MSQPDVLDTLKIKNNEIFLKKFHCLRTYEAFQSRQKPIEWQQAVKTYEEIQKKIIPSVKENEMVTVVFKTIENYQYEVKPISPLATPVQLEISPSRRISGSGPQNFKWSDRSVWEELQKNKRKDIDDVIVCNLNNYVTETTRFNLFFYDKLSDCVYTPDIESGCINGVYRRFVLDQGFIELPELNKKNIVQKNILIDDIEKYSIFVANSVRGVLKACLHSKN